MHTNDNECCNDFEPGHSAFRRVFILSALRWTGVDGLLSRLQSHSPRVVLEQGGDDHSHMSSPSDCRSPLCDPRRHACVSRMVTRICLAPCIPISSILLQTVEALIFPFRLIKAQHPLFGLFLLLQLLIPSFLSITWTFTSLRF